MVLGPDLKYLYEFVIKSGYINIHVRMINPLPMGFYKINMHPPSLKSRLMCCFLTYITKSSDRNYENVVPSPSPYTIWSYVF